MSFNFRAAGKNFYASEKVSQTKGLERSIKNFQTLFLPLNFISFRIVVERSTLEEKRKICRV